MEVCRGEIEAKRLALSTHLSAEHHFVRADPDRLPQAFWNLIKNAAKFTPAGGLLAITEFA